MMKKETLITLAQRAQCSVSTVSRVMSGNAVRYRISPQTVAHVLEQARRCNYTPSLLAKGLRTNRTDTLGLLIPSIENPFFAGIAGEVIRQARTCGYKVVVADTQESEQNERDGVLSLLARRVDGIIAVPCGQDAALFAGVRDGGVPLVLVDRFLPGDQGFAGVATDNYRGAVMATEHLLENGHRNIACIQGTPHAMPVQERVHGYSDALRAQGLARHITVTGTDFSVRNGYFEARRLLAREDRPSAIFALSNTILLGVIRAVRECGLRIPDDLSVIAFDDNELFDFLDPAVTCVRQPVCQIGRQAVELLMNALREPAVAPACLRLEPELIIRHSVRKLPR